MKNLIFLTLLLTLITAQGSTPTILEGQKLRNGNVIWTLPVADGTLNQVLKTNGAGILDWTSSGGGGSGTVTSVSLTMPAFFSVTGSPITTTGTLAVSLTNQSQNLIFAGPTSGSAPPTFRSLVAADIPSLDAAKITTGTFTSSQIPSLDAAKITTGTFIASQIPSLDASKITTGVFGPARGGTGLTIGGSDGNKLYGVNSGSSAAEFKTLVAGSNISIIHGSGSVTISSTAASSPAINGSRASPTLITAVAGLAFAGTNYTNYWFIAGNGGPVTVTANPQIAAGTNVGQLLTIIGRSATDTVTFQDGTGLSMNGAFKAALDSSITLLWDGTNWTELSRR